MQREDQPGEHRSRHREAAQDEHDEIRGRRVEHDVREMVAEKCVPPEPMLQPERGVQQRIILLRRAQLGPDAPQAAERAQLGHRDVTEVVPERTAVQRRMVGDERRAEDEKKEGDGPFRPPPLRVPGPAKAGHYVLLHQPPTTS